MNPILDGVMILPVCYQKTGLIQIPDLFAEIDNTSYLNLHDLKFYAMQDCWEGEMMEAIVTIM